MGILTHSSVDRWEDLMLYVKRFAQKKMSMVCLPSPPFLSSTYNFNDEVEESLITVLQMLCSKQNSKKKLKPI